MSALGLVVTDVTAGDVLMMVIVALDDDDWLGEVPEESAPPSPESRPGKGPPMSPYYEDTMPGWMPGDEEGTTRGAPRVADITEGGRGTNGGPKER